MSLEGPQFLKQKDPKLHTSESVEHAQEQRSQKGEEVHQKPAEKIADWLAVLERTHLGHRDDSRVLERIKNSYHKQYVIKSEAIPESAFILEQQIARNLGHGTVEITEEFKEQKREQIINDQTHSLDLWLDYLTAPEADAYPTWAKYWAFKSLVTMGKYEKSEQEDVKETARFTERTKDTVASFPPLNAAAFALTVGIIEAKIKQNILPKDQRQPAQNVSSKLSTVEFEKLIAGENFAKLYAQFLIEQPVYSNEGLQEIRGKWKTYPQGSAPDELVNSLEGYPLEWCIRNAGTAENYLNGGAMHLYYSINPDGEAVVPRLAIRMQGEEIAEIRGIANNQNLDPYITPVVEAKIKEFPDGEKYQKKSNDMKRVTDIENRVSKGGELTPTDLRFLYEIEGKIEGFGYQKDPRIEELLINRDIKVDLANILNVPKEQISVTDDEALKGNIKFHYGDLDLGDLTTAEGLTLPQSIGGGLNLDGFISVEGLTLPQSIGDYLYLGDLTTAEGLILPQSIGSNLDLHSLKTAEGLTLPQSVGGDLNLNGLITAEGLILPQSVGGGLYLGSLTSAEKNKLKVVFPQLNII
ncbi:MAG: hypothetical protein AAB453_04635 [Patescibacteria group bacterium]